VNCQAKFAFQEDPAEKDQKAPGGCVVRKELEVVKGLKDPWDPLEGMVNKASED
jgi:hypothetical protein